MIDVDYLRRKEKARRTRDRAELEYQKACKRLNLDPNRVPQSLAEITESEAKANGQTTQNQCPP